MTDFEFMYLVVTLPQPIVDLFAFWVAMGWGLL